MRGLAGRGVVVTGGASGIGLATVRRFLEEGARVCVLDCDADGCARVAAELPDLTAALTADVADRAQVDGALDEAVDRMGALDVVVNNAGISIRHDFLDITAEVPDCEDLTEDMAEQLQDRADELNHAIEEAERIREELVEAYEELMNLIG